MDPDATLARQSVDGDRDAFSELVRRHQVRIFNLARMLAGPADAEDLAQETFLRAWRAIRGFRGDSQFGTWLHQVALNVIRTHMRQRMARAGIWTSPDAGEDHRAEDVPAASDPESALADRDAIDAALGSLPMELREVVVLRDVEGWSYAEIARSTGVPAGTVMSRLFRARQRLRQRLGARRAPAGEMG